MMARYVLRRLVYLVVILALLTVLIFGITQALPGNVARMILGSYNAPETLRALEEKLGLNDPLAVQYWRWVRRFARGDLGESLVMDRPIGPVVGEAFGNSLALAMLSMVSVGVIGIGTGIVGALRHRRPADYLTSVAAFAGISLPEFFWGIVLIVLFAGYFEILPASGIGDAKDDWFTWAQHLVLPVATMTLALVAHVSRQTRSNMLDVLQSNYVRAARAKGLPERLVIRRHALRNAMLPTITVLALDVGFLIGDFAVVETVFAYPGFGRLTVFAIQQRDLPLIQACALLLAGAYCLATVAADLLYAYFDPRIRYGGGSDA
jgi:peptide/nickel transport system permease protein